MELDLIFVKSEITYIISHNYLTVKVDSYDSLPFEKKQELFIMLQNLLSRFGINLKIITAIIYF